MYKSVPCDGVYTNFLLLKMLGCEFDSNYDDIKCSFEYPVSKTNVFYTPNACYMLKPLYKKYYLIFKMKKFLNLVIH